MKFRRSGMDEVTGRTRNMVRICFAAFVLLVFSNTSCSLPVPRPAEPMTPLEQILVSQAAEESARTLYASIPEGSNVAIESFGLTANHSYMRGVIAGWLGRRGFHVSEKMQSAAYLVRVIVQTLGTDRSERIFGTEGVESSLLPVGLPPLTLFKRDANKGYVRFYMDIYENETGRLIHSTPLFEGSAYFNRYTVFFFITLKSTDLATPP
jgi:hypothetical protein